MSINNKEIELGTTYKVQEYNKKGNFVPMSQITNTFTILGYVPDSKEFYIYREPKNPKHEKQIVQMDISVIRNRINIGILQKNNKLSNKNLEEAYILLKKEEEKKEERKREKEEERKEKEERKREKEGRKREEREEESEEREIYIQKLEEGRKEEERKRKEERKREEENEAKRFQNEINKFRLSNNNNNKNLKKVDLLEKLKGSLKLLDNMYFSEDKKKELLEKIDNYILKKNLNNTIFSNENEKLIIFITFDSFLNLLKHKGKIQNRIEIILKKNKKYIKRNAFFEADYQTNKFLKLKFKYESLEAKRKYIDIDISKILLVSQEDYIKIKNIYYKQQNKNNKNIYYKEYNKKILEEDGKDGKEKIERGYVPVPEKWEIYTINGYNGYKDEETVKFIKEKHGHYLLSLRGKIYRKSFWYPYYDLSDNTEVTLSDKYIKTQIFNVILPKEKIDNLKSKYFILTDNSKI